MNKPFQNFRDGTVELTVWKNKKEDNVFYSTTVSNSYKGDDGEWSTSHYFAPNELLKVSQLIDRAYQAITDDKSSGA